MEFGERLREIRVERNMKQQTLADAVNIALRTYQHYEKGDREPSLSTLIALADALDVSVDELLGRTESK